MWFQRDFLTFFEKNRSKTLDFIKVLKGPRQVGKTSLLERLPAYKVLYFDDIHLRHQARENPKFFLDQFSEPLVLDEAALVPISTNG